MRENLEHRVEGRPSCVCEQESTFSYFYRPQTKLRQGNIFTPVCHSVHGGGGGGSYPNMHCSGGVPAPRGVCSRGVCSRRGAWSGVSARGGGGSAWGVYSQWGLLQGVCSGGGCLVEIPQDGHCCGRYTSYWNAFLLFRFLVKFVELDELYTVYM